MTAEVQAGNRHGVCPTCGRAMTFRRMTGSHMRGWVHNDVDICSTPCIINGRTPDSTSEPLFCAHGNVRAKCPLLHDDGEADR